jgi:hypothetical protein
MLGLAVPASAYTYDYFFKSPQADRGFGSGSTTNSDSAIAFHDAQNENSKAFFQLFLNNFSMSKSWKYTTDQSNDASVSVGEYLTYVLHGLKGTFQNSGTLVSMSPDNGSGVGYVYDSAKDYFVSTWVGSRPTITSTDANRWRVQTLSDNHSGSWMYQVAHSLAQSGLTAEALMNWSNPDGGTLFVPATSAKYSWFNQVLDSVNNSRADVSDLAKESTLYAVYSSGKTLNTKVDTLNGKVATETTLSKLYNTFTTNRDYGSINSFGDGKGNTVIQARKVTQSSYPKGVLDSLYSLMVGEVALNNNLLKLDEILSTKNDRALKTATDGLKPYVTNYVSDKGTNYGDSFTIGDTISGGLKPDLSTSDASSAIGGLFSPDSSDYWGWFSSATDSDLHPAASGVFTLSLDDEPSSQDIADSETVWVINPYASSSDIVSDFFGGE